ncbi:MAG TPA: molybdopterin biosynthesis protein [Pseudonocardiaceae bacterium]|nr:molybdopterin biosynthesis protein [Pseudonocardiaceae bacterium]
MGDLPAAQALDAWRAACAAAGCPDRVGTERLGLAAAIGRVTAESLWARRSSPAFDSAGMDGIAVRAADTASASAAAPLTLTDFDLIDTGDPLSVQRDAVVMREHVRPVGQGVELVAAVPPYQHVRSIGEDVAAGELLLPPGHRLRAVDVAAVAAAGVSEILVRRRPVVAILPTGDEIRPLGWEPGIGEILDTNSLMLAGQAGEHGCAVLPLPIEPDDPERIAAAVLAAAPRADLVVIIAGSSGGRSDHTASVVARVGTLAVHGVAVRPGHPVVLGTVGTTAVLGAPGYPVSAALSFELFAAPLLAALQGTTTLTRPRAQARLARTLTSPIGKDDWVRLRLGRVGGRLVATPLPRGAGALTSLVRADGLAVVPIGQGGLPAGTDIQVNLLRGLEEIDRTIVVIGSHDLVIDVAASALRDVDPTITLASSTVGSLAGLQALRDGLCHLAGCHLLDPDTGEYTLPYLPRVLGEVEVTVIRLVHREQGLIVAPGNPLQIAGIEDLRRPGLRYVNRQPESGTRMLLDYELRRRGIEPDDVAGYRREERTHLAVAAAVAGGRADAGMGILAAARLHGLDFVPVTQEPYDLVLTRDTYESPLLAPLWTLLANPQFHNKIATLDGYSCAETGHLVV